MGSKCSESGADAQQRGGELSALGRRVGDALRGASRSRNSASVATKPRAAAPVAGIHPGTRRMTHSPHKQHLLNFLFRCLDDHTGFCQVPYWSRPLGKIDPSLTRQL